MLAWNAPAATLLTDFDDLPPGHRNKAWLVFRHAEVRSRFANWEAKARDIVAYLRMDAARHPGDPALAALVTELSEHSADFRELWDEHDVRDKAHGGYHLRHREVGEFTLPTKASSTAPPPDTPGTGLLPWLVCGPRGRSGCLRWKR